MLTKKNLLEEVDKQKKRLRNDDPSDNDFKGPWAVYEGEEQFDKINIKDDVLKFDDFDDKELKIIKKEKYLNEMDTEFHIPKVEKDDLNIFKPSFHFGINVNEIKLN